MSPMVKNTGYRNSMAHTAALGARERRPFSNNRFLGFSWYPKEVETRIHLRMPKELYDNFGSQDPWIIGFQHYVKQARDGKGAYIKHADDSCVVCAYSNPQAFDLKGVEVNTSLAKCYKDMFVGVEGWIEEPFHRISTRGTDGKEYNKWIMCEKKGCKMCQQNVTKIFGQRFYTDFSYAAWHFAIEPLMEQVQQDCKCGGVLCVHDYRCSSCGGVMLDFLNRCSNCKGEDIALDIESGSATCQKCGSEWSIYESANPDVVKIVRNEQVCPHCKASGYPVANLSCACPGQDKCNKNPDPYGIFDVQMTLIKKGSNPNSNKGRRLEVVRYKIQEPDPRLFDPQYQGWGPSKEEQEAATLRAQRNAEPLPLKEIFAPLSPSEQATLIGVANPFGSNANTEGPKYNSQTTSYERDYT